MLPAGTAQADPAAPLPSWGVACARRRTTPRLGQGAAGRRRSGPKTTSKTKAADPGLAAPLWALSVLTGIFPRIDRGVSDRESKAIFQGFGFTAENLGLREGLGSRFRGKHGVESLGLLGTRF